MPDNNIVSMDFRSIWHPYTQHKTGFMPINIVRGEGTYLYDENGNRYIDAISSWWVNLHGHGHPYIREKIYEQFGRLEHVLFAGFTHLPAVHLAERLLKHLPADFSRVFYSDNGSTAVETALKMAIQYWANKGRKKIKILSLVNGYHGDTFGAMSVSDRSIFTKPFSDLLFESLYVDPVNFSETSLPDLGKENIAAFIYEPLVQGASGMIMYDADKLNILLRWCRKNNILAIADEVFTGFGRTGKFLATDHVREKPDIICFSKGLTGGVMTLGATACTEDIFSAFLSDDPVKTFFHGHSYTANPVACAAALASLDLLEREECLDNIQRISVQQKEILPVLLGHSFVRTARVLGTILALEIKTPEKTNYLSEVRDMFYGFFLSQGVLLRPLGNVIYVLPPYCISEEDLSFVHKTIFLALNKLAMPSADRKEKIILP